MNSHCNFIDLGFQAYQETYAIQQVINQRRIDGLNGDVLILVEHTPTLTIGRNGGLQNILAPRELLRREGITVHEIERGGNVTYHGPGQLVAYPILDLSQRNKDLHRYARQLEEVIIKTLAYYGIKGRRREGYPGVWVGDEKIAFLGVAVNKWVTKHGFAFNIACNLNHFKLIVPCGIPNCKVTSLAKMLGREPDFHQVSEKVKESFAEVFEKELQEASLEELLG
ncbi:MAG: lipoyl(octanoyl) transferase LipB [Desulfitobacteriaceae bacterium]